MQMSSETKQNKFLFYWLPVIIWAGLIFGLSSVPDLKSGLVSNYDLVIRTFAHFAEFAVLAILFSRIGYLEEKSKRYGLIFIISVVAAALYAVSDEYHQSFIEGRQAAAVDVLIDSVGAFIGAATYYFYKAKNRYNK